MRKRGRGGGGRGSRSGRGGEGRLLHGRLARQELLKHRVHLTADHLLSERREGEAKERGRDIEGKAVSVTFYSVNLPPNKWSVSAHENLGTALDASFKFIPKVKTDIR